MYFQAAKWGKNGPLRYIAGFLITFIVGYGLIGPIPLQYELLKKSGHLEDIVEAEGFMNKMFEFQEAAEVLSDATGFGKVLGNNNAAFLLLTFIFIGALAVFWWVIQVIHKKRMKWIATGAPSFRWNQFWFAFLLGALLIIASVIITYFLDPGELKFRFDPMKFGLLVLIASVMIPIQAGWEELFFRGYLMQGFGLLFKNKIAALLVTTLLFAAVHMANPEVMEHGVGAMFPMYFIMGLSFGLLVLLSDGLELAMGYHIANNYFLSLFMTSPESVLQTDSLFYSDSVQEMGGQVWSLLLFNVIVIAICAWRYGWHKNWQERLFGAID